MATEKEAGMSGGGAAPLETVHDELTPTTVRQRPSHPRLMRNLPEVSLQLNRTRPLDAIVVPAAREAGQLRPIAGLAATSGTFLLVLASRDCRLDEVSEVVATTPGCRALVVEVPASYRHPHLSFETSGHRFRHVTLERNSDLSLKRNLGLLLARLLDWNKIMFVDDDISGIGRDDLVRVAAHLDDHQVAGFVAREYPDNWLFRIEGVVLGASVAG
jgi:hypothetical protein